MTEFCNVEITPGVPQNFWRPCSDSWYYGALLTTGDLIPFESLKVRFFCNIYWVDLESHRYDCEDYNFKLGKIKGSRIDRTTITVNMDHIIAI
jgi:hypothetical protein